MPFKIINKQVLADKVKRLDILAPSIAMKVKPGQYIGVCAEENDERLPLTVTSADSERGHISVIFPELGRSTKRLGALPISEFIHSIAGPFGREAHIEKKGIVVCIANGMGIAHILPICRALKDKGNKVIGIIGAKSKRTLLLEPQIRLSCHKILLATEDGSYERKGLATDVLEDYLEKHKVNQVYAIGSVELMDTTCMMTRPKKIETLVRLNPLMVDCTGICGSCRVKVDGEDKLACVEGPEFNGHKVDFEDLKIRMNAYEEPEGWRNRQLKNKAQKKESKTLMKFLSGILKR